MPVLITSLSAREILDSRGNPTIEVTVATDKGASGTAAVPSGASTGSHEAVELRDGGERFNGLGVRRAVQTVQEAIAPLLIGQAVADQATIDQLMITADGTEQKSNFGGNSLLGVSVAVAKAAAAAKQIPLVQHLESLFEPTLPRKNPLLFFNLLNGGRHAGNNLSFQEFMVVPDMGSPEENIATAYEIQAKLREKISQKYGRVATGLGDEGGFAPPLTSVREALDLLTVAVDAVHAGHKTKIAIDAAANEFFEAGQYVVDGATFNTLELRELYVALAHYYPILSIEDPFEENDFVAFAESRDNGSLIIGDDLTVTNEKRVETAAAAGSLDGLIIKPNQIGTVSETIATIQAANKHGLHCIASHRSGETSDDFIVDMAYAFRCYGLKAGALARGERVAKYNRVLALAV